MSDDDGGYDTEGGRREDDYLDSKGDTASQSEAISKSVDQPENTDTYEDIAFHTRSYYLSALGLTPTKGKIEARLLVDILRRRYINLELVNTEIVGDARDLEEFNALFDYEYAL